MNIFLSLQKPSFYIKEQLSKIKFKIRICLVFFYFSKMAKTVFKLKHSKTKFYPSFSLFLGTTFFSGETYTNIK